MTTIKTQYGNFGRFEDLLHFMKDEGLKEIRMTVSYVFAQVTGTNQLFTIEEIEQILKR